MVLCPRPTTTTAPATTTKEEDNISLDCLCDMFVWPWWSWPLPARLTGFGGYAPCFGSKLHGFQTNFPTKVFLCLLFSVVVVFVLYLTTQIPKFFFFFDTPEPFSAIQILARACEPSHNEQPQRMNVCLIIVGNIRTHTYWDVAAAGGDAGTVLSEPPLGFHLVYIVFF